MPRFIDAPQQSDAWFEARAGHASASRFKDILAGKGAREAYMYELVGERLAGQSKRSHSSKTMDWGNTNEPLAREEYKIQTGNLIQLVGFAVHSRIMWVGASSDGLVDDDGCCEIKSPFNVGVHARTLALGMPSDHHAQTQGNLWILDRKWIDFCSYDPGLPSPYNLHIERHHRDESFIKHLEKEVKLFLAEVAVALRDIQQKYKH